MSASLALIEIEANPEMPEPEGWYRCPMDGRRRPGGDKTKEYIAL